MVTHAFDHRFHDLGQGDADSLSSYQLKVTTLGLVGVSQFIDFG